MAMAAALPFIAAGGLALSAVSTISNGIAASQSAAYNAQIQRNNAIAAEQNRQYSIHAGQVQEEIAGRKAAAQGAAVEAGIAANNIDVNSGSALEVRKSERETGLLSEQNVSQQAALQAYGYQTQAASDTAQAGLLDAQSSYAIPGAVLGAGGNLLSGASLVGLRYSEMTSGGGGVHESYH